jgi:uncharacterized Tic20 family protein
MQPTEDERVLAALSHASIVANIVNLAGMIATALIWTMQRERSRYVRAHALQSLVYQGLVLVSTVFLLLFWGLCVGLSLLPVLLRPDLYHITTPPRSFWLALVGLAVPIGFSIAATLYGLYGAYRVYRGRPFRYPFVGRLVHRDLSADAAPTLEAPAAAPQATGIYDAPAPAQAATQPDVQAPARVEAPPDVALPGPPEAPTPIDSEASSIGGPAGTKRRARRRPPGEGE